MLTEGCVKLPSLPEGEITAIEVHRANPYVELGISIVGGNETPLINIVIQEVYRDGVIARDGRLLAGDQILQVAGKNPTITEKVSFTELCPVINRSLGHKTITICIGKTISPDIDFKHCRYAFKLTAFVDVLIGYSISQ